MLQPGLSYALRAGPVSAVGESRVDPMTGSEGISISVEVPGVLTNTEGGTPGKGWAGTVRFPCCWGL